MGHYRDEPCNDYDPLHWGSTGVAGGAMGCTVCSLCNTNRCPRGVATQTFEPRIRLNVDEAATRIHNFLSATMKEVRILTQLV